MHRNQKERIVEDLTERLRRSEALIVADYRGLTMPQIDALRGELLEHGARFSVVKNTLTRRAAEAAGAETLLALLDGPTAIAFLETDGDPVAVAKALTRVARETKVLAVRGGIFEGKPIGAVDVEELSKLPPVDMVRALLLAAIAAPLTTVVGLFTAPLRDVVALVDARIAQLGDSADAESPSEGAEPEAEAAMDQAAAEESAAAEQEGDEGTRAQAEPAVEEGTETEPKEE